jgi:outer membrane murein-binding lipoprotein Lpp
MKEMRGGERTMEAEACKNELVASSRPQVCVDALSNRFAKRGLIESVRLEAEKQKKTEEETRALAPCSYRLSLFSEGMIRGVYRRGKDTMNGEDLLRYISECRAIRKKEKTFENDPSVYEQASEGLTEETEERAIVPAKTKHGGVGLTPLNVGAFIKERFPMWFNLGKGKSDREKKFPLSAFAAVIAVCICMVMIVASALMVTGAEAKISKLKNEVVTLNSEIQDLEEDLRASGDLMEIRRIAVEEYGMVEADYLKMDYITLKGEDRVESFQKEERRGIGLSAILSALGLKK